MGLLHSSILSTMGNVDLVALCEKSALVRRFGKRIIPDIRIVSDLEELSSMRPDAVFVTTPEASHFPVIKAIYDRGIARNIFVEKPLASNYDEARELCEMADASGGVNMVGYNRRLSVTFGKAKQILDDGTLGQPLSFEGHAYSSDFVGVKAGPRKSGRGGVLSDLGSHVVDLALWMLGDLEVISSNLVSLLGAVAEDSAELKVRASSSGRDVEGELKCSWCAKEYRLPEIRLVVKGTNGMMLVNEDKVEMTLDDGSPSLWYKHDLGDDVPFFIGGSEYMREDELFIRAVADGSPVEPSFRTASRVEEILDQARKLDREAKAV